MLFSFEKLRLTCDAGVLRRSAFEAVKGRMREEGGSWSFNGKGKKGWFLYNKPWHLRNGHNRDPLPDEMYAEFTRDILSQKHEKPFTIFVGLVKTHTPLYAPQEYFDTLTVEATKGDEAKAAYLESTPKPEFILNLNYVQGPEVPSLEDAHGFADSNL